MIRNMSRLMRLALNPSLIMCWAKADGVPKTPAWAAEKCGVPEWTIKALARDWAKKVTSICIGNGGPGYPRTLRHRTGPAAVHSAGHAGAGQARPAPGQDARMEPAHSDLSLCLIRAKPHSTWAAGAKLSPPPRDTGDYAARTAGQSR